MSTFTVLESSSQTLVSTWAKGITFNAAGSVSGGYYDVNKDWVADHYMCWAASASNIIAWWQDTYGTTASTSSTEPEAVRDIYNEIKKYWSNDGNSPSSAFVWWLAGSQTTLSYSVSGGYYNAYYNGDNIESSAYYCELVSCSATSTATMLESIFENGGMVSLGVNTCDGVNWNAGHAITLWGVTKDEETGHLTALHLTDSDDYTDGLFTVHVRYNEANGCYEMLDERYPTYFLTGISVLMPFRKNDNLAPATPTGAGVKVNGQVATFSWNAVSDASGLTYEVIYQHAHGQYSKIVVTADTSLSLSLGTAGTYYWWLRVRDGAGNLSGEHFGGQFYYGADAPLFNYRVPTQRKLSSGRTEVTFIWSSSDDLSYELRVNGAVVYTGKDTSYNQTFADGVYDYSITAKNAAGYTSSLGGTVVCDTAAPPAPTKLQVTLQEEQALFSWQGGADATGIAYILRYRCGTGPEVEVPDLTATSLSVKLEDEGEYSWSVQAVDGAGKSSTTVKGSTFTYGMAFTLDEPSPKKTAEGMSQVSFHWSANGTVDCVLEIGGKRYTGSGKTGTLTVTLDDGSYEYSFTASDAVNSGTKTGTLTCDTMAPPEPAALRAELQQQGKQVLLSWQAVDDPSGVSYELEWRRQGQTTYTKVSSKAANYTLALTQEAYYEWRVRAVDGAGQASGWVSGTMFTNDVSAPQLTLGSPVPKKLDENETQVSFSWSCNEAATFKLVIDGKTVWSGTATSYVATLADGVHEFQLTATDSSNKSSSQGGSLTCDTMPPPVPSELRAQVQPDSLRAQLSWQAVQDVSGATYELQWRLRGETTYHSETCPTPDFSFTIEANSFYEWRVRAVDGLGQASAWVGGAVFSSDTLAPVLTLAAPVLHKVSAGKTQVTLRWTSNEAARYTLEIDGRTIELGERTSYTLTLPDGSYSYRITATDDAFNSSQTSGQLSCDSTPPPNPTKLSVSPWRREQFIFEWEGVEDVSGVHYELCLHLPSGKDELITVSSGESHTMRMPEEGRITWSLRAVDGAGQASAWVEGGMFTYGNVPPQLTLHEPQLEKAGEGKVRVALSWSSDDELEYTLEIDGEPVELDSRATSWAGILADGEHNYTLSVRDAAGNTGSQAGSFRFDATAPALESTTHATLGQDARLSWRGEAGASYSVRIDKLAEEAVGAATEYELSGLKDGKHSYIITATDDAGNEATLKGSFTLDTTAPKPRLRKASYAKTGEGRVLVTLSWSGETGARYRVEAGGKTLYEGTDCTCSFEYDDGEHEYTLFATDASGNTSEVVSTLSYDASAPTGTTLGAVEAGDIASPAKGKAKITFRWEGEEGATYSLMVDGKKAWSGKKTECTVKLADGEHSYCLIAKDKAGNSITTEEQTFRFDATAPVLTLGTPSLSEGKATLYWSASEAVAHYTLELLDARKTEIFSGSVEGGAGSFTTAEALAAGKYSYTLTATDMAGNPSAVKKGSFSVSATADDEAPAVTDVSHNVKAGKEGMVSATLSWKGEKGASYTLYVDNAIAYVGKGTKKTLTLAGDVAHSYCVVATDKAGNRSGEEEATGRFDYLAPGLTHALEAVTDTSGRKPVTTTTARLSWTPAEGVAYTLKVDGKAKAVTGSSYEWPGLKDGKHSYTLTATDAAGNTITHSGSFVADTKAPKVTLRKPKFTKLAEGEVMVTLTWKGEKGAGYRLYVDDEEQTLTDPTATTATLRLSDGEHRYKVVGVDAALNEGVAEGTYGYDATAPDIILGSLTGSISTSKGVTRTIASFDWVGEEGVSYTVTVDGKKLGVKKLTDPATKLTTSTLSVTTAALAAGLHEYSIIARDKTGNTNIFSGSFTSSSTGELAWVDAAPSPLPATAQALEWGSTDNTGIRTTGGLYSFELTEARQLLVKLDGLDADATLTLRKEGGQGSITLAANATTGLDRELTLSAGTYCLQVTGIDGTALPGSYMLDLELEKNGRKQPQQQAYLA